MGRFWQGLVIYNKSSMGHYRFKHFHIHQVMLPYSNFILTAVVVYFLFIGFDFAHLDEHFEQAVLIRVVLSICCISAMLYFKKQNPKYLDVVELILICLIYWSLMYIGQLAMAQNDYNYQLGGVLVMAYVAALSRMPFAFSFISLSYMMLLYWLMIAPDRLAMNYDAEVDRLSIYFGLYCFGLIASIRRDSETNKAYEQYRQIRRHQLHLKASRRDLADQAVTDPLSKLRNRHYFSQQASAVEKHAKQNQYPISVLMIDIDNFKIINDSYGHPFGDEVIQQVAKVIQRHCSVLTDMNIRYGGEEFLSVFIRLSQDELATLANLLIDDVAKLQLSMPDVQVTVSIGGASAQARSSSLNNLIIRADNALYRAKEEGKNCLRMSQ
ncbi:GGDEF domain-containing protein [Shewanella maritima]|uniref:GGDEF domain-containing protein n=1 Tax=Shewanella maritima TaxID=2520507 RepID=UPI0037350E1F